MNKFFIFVIFYLLQIDITYAQSNAATFNIINPVRISGEGGVASIVNSIINALVIVGIPIASLAYLWAGFLFLTSGGQEKSIATAKKSIIWTTVGLIFLLIARSIVPLIQNILAV